MPTNDERRDVAARLRRLSGHREVDKEFVHEALELYMGECVDGYDPVSVSKLADLIEPEERTCERGIEMFSHAYPNEIVCDSDCVSTYVFPLTCGHEVELLENKWPSYCPHCGARVVADA